MRIAQHEASVLYTELSVRRRAGFVCIPRCVARYTNRCFPGVAVDEDELGIPPLDLTNMGYILQSLATFCRIVTGYLGIASACRHMVEQLRYRKVYAQTQEQ